MLFEFLHTSKEIRRFRHAPCRVSAYRVSIAFQQAAPNRVVSYVDVGLSVLGRVWK